MENNQQISQEVIDMAMKLFINAFKERQAQLGISRYRLSKISGIKESNISRIWSGESKEITLPTFFRLCHALEINPYLVPKELDKNKKQYMHFN